MKLTVHLKEAISQLLVSKLRSSLAVLGILVGTASVVAMVSIGQLAEAQILSQFEQLGINLLSVSISEKSSEQSKLDSLSLADAHKLAQASSDITIVAPYITSYGDISFAGHELDGNIVGATPEIFNIAELKMAKGRRLSFLDHNQYYAVIGYKLRQKIEQQSHVDPIGKQIQAGNALYTIVGTMQTWPTNFFFQTDFDRAVVIPASTALRMREDATVSNLAVRLQNAQMIDQAKKQIKQYIDQHTTDQRIYTESPKSLVSSMQKSSRTMTLLLGMVGSISLLVGGIGVMNIMLASVAERHKEIGIRLAIGARERDIQLQFLMESTTLALFGGLAGIIVGIMVTYGVALYSNWDFHIFVLPPAIGGLVSILSGIFFGFYPARKAAKLDPIQTLRAE